MANYSPWIIVVLVTMMVVLLVKMNRLYGELDVLKHSKQLLEQEVDKCQSNVKSLLTSMVEKKKVADSRLREAQSISETLRRQLSEVKEELANKGVTYDALQKIIDETKTELELTKRELSKAEGEAQRFQNLYLEENSKLTGVRGAYEKLRQLVTAERLKTGGPPASNARESFTKRQITGGAAAGERNDIPVVPKHDTETQQKDSLADRLTKNQEQDPNYANEGEKPQQEQQQQEETQQGAQQQKPEHQQVEGNKDDAENVREMKGREEEYEEEGVKDDEREKDKEERVSRIMRESRTG